MEYSEHIQCDMFDNSRAFDDRNNDSVVTMNNNSKLTSRELVSPRSWTRIRILIGGGSGKATVLALRGHKVIIVSRAMASNELRSPGRVDKFG